MNYYKHHLNDYASATAHLSWDEDAAYRRLLDLYYRTEKAITPDISEACRLVRAISKSQRAAVASVLAEFFVLGDDGWRQKRCDEEIIQATQQATRSRENGNLGGRPRKPNSNPEETQQVSEPKPSGFLRARGSITHYPLPTIQEEETDATASSKKGAGNGTRGSRIPDDWRPDGEGRAFAEQQGLDADAVLAEFGDYWRAKPGAGGVKLDWCATWRNWCRHAAERRNGSQGAGRRRSGIGGVSVTQAVGDVITAFRDRA